jgi:hypothetical protein
VPTKKQRRRQQKLRRHEYEEVWVDAEGNVVEIEDDEEGDASTNGASRTQATQKPARATSGRRGGRPVPEPSWGRVAKRGLFFAPIMFFLIAVLPGGDRLGTTEKVFIALQYTLMLVLFMYLTERITYRIWRRRQGDAQPQKR